MKLKIICGAAVCLAISLAACGRPAEQTASASASYAPEYLCVDGQGRRVPEDRCGSQAGGGSITSNPVFWYYLGSMMNSGGGNNYYYPPSYGAPVTGGRVMDRDYRPPVSKIYRSRSTKPYVPVTPGKVKPTATASIVKPSPFRPASTSAYRPSSPYTVRSTTTTSSYRPSYSRPSSSSYRSSSSSRHH